MAQGLGGVVLLGTPESAVTVFEAVRAVVDPVLVVTRPDRPRGRSGRPEPPATKLWAARHHIPVAQPERSQELAAILERAGPLDLGLLVAYGALVRPEALAVPRAGILNVHFSLLPRWRGAAPVPRAMLAGDTRTGVSIMRLDPGLDTGPVVAMTSTAIAPDETGGEVTARLARLGAELTVAVLAPYLAGRVVTVPQPGTGVTEAPKLSGDDRAIDWTHPPPETLARIMALSPRPGAVTRWRGEPFRILRACPAGGTGLGPGAITGPRPVRVGCAGGEIELVEVQPAGRSPMAAEAWFRGVRPAPMGFD